MPIVLPIPCSFASFLSISFAISSFNGTVISIKPLSRLDNPTPVVTSDYTLTFYQTPPPSVAISNPNAFTNTNTTGNTQTIYVIATNIATGCKSPVTPITLEVNPKPTITVPANFATCDTDGTNDGYYNYPLDILIPNIIGTQPIAVPPATYSVTFYNSQADAEAATMVV